MQQQFFLPPPNDMGSRAIMTPMGMGMPVTPFMPLIKKPDFPPDVKLFINAVKKKMQMVFVIPQIANVGRQTDKRKCRPLDSVIAIGVASDWIVERFEEPWDYEERMEKKIKLEELKPVVVPAPKPLTKDEKNQIRIQEHLMKWNPFEAPEDNVTYDPYKTLFVGRLSYQTTEKKLKKEYEQYGSIKKVCIVKKKDKNDPRGYAFIEFEHKKDFLNAYKYGDGKKIDGKRVIVDFERGRTVLTWRPRRLGGGLGDTRKSKSEEAKQMVDEPSDRRIQSEERGVRRVDTRKPAAHSPPKRIRERSRSRSDDKKLKKQQRVSRTSGVLDLKERGLAKESHKDNNENNQRDFREHRDHREHNNINREPFRAADHRVDHQNINRDKREPKDQRDNNRGDIRQFKPDNRDNRNEQRDTRNEQRDTRNEPKENRNDNREPRETRNDNRDNREFRNEPRETRNEPRETRNDNREFRNEPRETRNEPRETRNEQRETRNEPRETRNDNRIEAREGKIERETRTEPREHREQRDSRQVDNRDQRGEGREREKDRDRASKLEKKDKKDKKKNDIQADYDSAAQEQGQVDNINDNDYDDRRDKKKKKKKAKDDKDNKDKKSKKKIRE